MENVTITANVVDGSSISPSVDAGATVQTNVTFGTPITANVVTGAKGDKGDPGAKGDKGDPGQGLATGGTANQALTKIDGTDYNTQWSTVDKTFVGLGNVDNTSDANKPVSTATQTALDAKVAKSGDTMTGPLIINADNSGSAQTLKINDTITNPGFTFNGDTGLFRSGAGQLQTQGLIWAIRATLGAEAIAASTSGDTVRRIALHTDGSLRLSSGSAISDSRITRNTSGGFQFNNTTGTSGSPGNPTIKVQPTGVMSGSASTGGAVLIDMQSQVGSGLSVYSNGGVGQLGRLVNITAANSNYDQSALRVDYAGTSHAVSVSSTSSGSNAQALNVVSTNTNDTAVGIQGSETSRGTVKIIHLFDGGASDSSASALSLRANGAGTAAQGIFFDAESGGTTGALIKMRNDGVDKLVVDKDGKITAGEWSATSIAVNKGGTGATDASGARTNLGLGNVNNTSDLSKPVSTQQKAFTIAMSVAL